MFDRGLARGDAPTATGPVTPAGMPPGLIENVGRLRSGVAETIAPPGTHRIGPSASDTEDARVQEVNAAVGRFMQASPEERDALMQDSAMVGALKELGVLDDAFDDATALPPGSGATFGVTGGGDRTMTGGTRGEQDTFVSSLPTRSSPTSGRSEALDLLGEVGASDGELAFAETLGDDELEKFATDRLKSSKVNPTEAERRAAAVFPRAERGFEEISKLVDGFGGAPALSTLFGKGAIARFGQRGEIQRFQVAGRAVVSAFLRFESGAAISEKEFTDAVETFIPQFNDKVETVEFKLEILKVQLDALESAASLVMGATAEFDEDKRIEELLDQGFSDEQINAILGTETN